MSSWFEGFLELFVLGSLRSVSLWLVSLWSVSLWSVSLRTVKFVILLEYFLRFGLRENLTCGLLGFFLNFSLVVLTHEPLLTRSGINVIFVCCYVLQFL